LRSRVSDKKRKIIIISAIVFTVMAIAVIVWKLVPYTRSLHLDFDDVHLDCTSVTVLSDGSFKTALSDGTLPEELVTDEVKKVMDNPDAEICLIGLGYSINSEKELDKNAFSVKVEPMEHAVGFCVYTPVTNVKKSGNIYTFSQYIILDKMDVRSFLLEKELPRPFQGPLRFELSYVLDGTDKVKSVGFKTE